MKQEGPTITTKGSCLDCKHCRSESYQCQGDSGSIVSCSHPALELSRRIGDTTWRTPDWCPVPKPEHPHTAALRRLVEAVDLDAFVLTGDSVDALDEARALLGGGGT